MLFPTISKSAWSPKAKLPKELESETIDFLKEVDALPKRHEFKPLHPHNTFLDRPVTSAVGTVETSITEACWLPL